jgi:hypothetical protein
MESIWERYMAILEKTSLPKFPPEMKRRGDNRVLKTKTNFQWRVWEWEISPRKFAFRSPQNAFLSIFTNSAQQTEVGYPPFLKLWGDLSPVPPLYETLSLSNTTLDS